jgi:hypothetical protein
MEDMGFKQMYPNSVIPRGQSPQIKFLIAIHPFDIFSGGPSIRACLLPQMR